MDRPSVRRWPVAIVASAVVAWAGMFVHNIADVPGQTLASPETGLPSLLTLLLTLLWFVRPIRRGATWALLVWAWISLVGGAMSVLPLEILPFRPVQTLEHYGFHAVYAATQVPLIVVTTLWLRDERRARSGAAEEAV